MRSFDPEVHRLSEPIDQLDHVKIGARGVSPLKSCVGVMHKSVTHPESSVERNTGTGSHRELEMAAIVLLLEGMPA